uniref:Protein kinase domain-containing protein n=1 Tax=Rhabditophanes sp. KR3021 TaxID=114890 RepID=A0AC35UE54_9BILA
MVPDAAPDREVEVVSEKSCKPSRQLIGPDTIVDSAKHKYQILESIGSGGFGDVYKIVRISDNRTFAMKTELKSTPGHHVKQRVPFEIFLLKEVHASRHIDKSYFTKLIDEGSDSIYFFMVCEIVGKNLNDLKRYYGQEGILKPSTIFRVGIETMKSLSNLHLVGYVHRDVKPSNFACGHGKDCEKIYLLDFGISKCFEDRTIPCAPKESPSTFMGTVRYASRACHGHAPQTPRDDVESWLYMFVEMFDAYCIPWRRSVDRKQVCAEKQKFFEEFANETYKGLPKNVKQLLSIVDKSYNAKHLRFKEITAKLTELAKEEGVNLVELYEWNPNQKFPEISLKSTSISKDSETDSNVSINPNNVQKI